MFSLRSKFDPHRGAQFPTSMSSALTCVYADRPNFRKWATHVPTPTLCSTTALCQVRCVFSITWANHDSATGQHFPAHEPTYQRLHVSRTTAHQHSEFRVFLRCRGLARSSDWPVCGARWMFIFETSLHEHVLGLCALTVSEILFMIYPGPDGDEGK